MRVGKSKWFLLVPTLAVIGGCFGYRDVVDPYYPKRYQVQARNSVRNLVNTQVENGAILDKTVWDFYFDKGTAELNNMGQTHLKRLAQERPAPCPTVFLQTAQSPPAMVQPANPIAALRDARTLDQKRQETVVKYLNALCEGRECPEFQVVLHDPPEVYGSGLEAAITIPSKTRSVTGTRSSSGGQGATGGSSGGGASGAGSGTTP
ncbi:MAG: hypothetical protein EXR99_13610 [Gemmataceae bacterium]|nr:hypothetical protein [Gemmataceae bacterium]